MGAAAALVAAQAAFLLAPELTGPAELKALIGVLAVCAVIAAFALPLAEVPLLLVPALAGGTLLVAGAQVAGLDSVATPVEALTWGAAGVAFARVLDEPLLAVALPLFVGTLDLVLGVGASEAAGVRAPGDALTLTLPDAAGRLAAADAVFLGAFATYARALGLRSSATLAGMAAALVLAVLAGPLPSLTLLAAGALLPNLDRLPARLGRGRDGEDPFV